MHEVTPQVYLISRPQLDWNEVTQYLESIGGEEWLKYEESGAISDAESVVEFAGRGCYKSFATGLNANVTRIRKDSADYLANIIDVGHFSVLEHAQWTFVFQDISRVLTHELIRHRHAGISQESMRFVRLEDVPMVIPTVFADDQEVLDRGADLVRQFEEFNAWVCARYKLDEPGTDFHMKKTVTSAARRWAPTGHATMMTWSANARTLREVIVKRTAPGVEAEIGQVFDVVAELMTREAPLLFGDLKPHNIGESWMAWHRD